MQAQQFLVQLQERLAKFGLSLNASKTRLIESGRFAARNRRKRDLGKPQAFDFLGFTHCCSTNRNGGFKILRLSVKKRMRATLQAIRDELYGSVWGAADNCRPYRDRRDADTAENMETRLGWRRASSLSLRFMRQALYLRVPNFCPSVRLILMSM